MNAIKNNQTEEIMVVFDNATDLRTARQTLFANNSMVHYLSVTNVSDITGYPLNDLTILDAYFTDNTFQTRGV